MENRPDSESHETISLREFFEHWVEFTDVDYFQNDVIEFDTILFGDMFYSSEFCDLVYSWLLKIASNGSRKGSSESHFFPKKYLFLSSLEKFSIS